MAGPDEVALSGINDIDALLTGYRWDTHDLTFSFPDSGFWYVEEQFFDIATAAQLAEFAALSLFIGPGLAITEHFLSSLSVADVALNGFQEFNDAQKNAAREAINQVTAVAALTIGESDEGLFDHAIIRFAGSRKPDDDAPAFGIPPLPRAELLVGNGVLGDTWFLSDGRFDHPALGNKTHWSILHELGHALGLKHAHESGLFGGSIPDWLEEALTDVDGPSLSDAQKNSMEFTVMTYRSAPGGPNFPIGEPNGYPQSLMMLDIQALQYMYGANFQHNADDTTYRWDPITGTMAINGEDQGTPGANRVFMTIWDGNGTDTYDLSGYTDPIGVSINLIPGEWTITSQNQLADLDDNLNGLGRISGLAQGNIANAKLYQGDTRSLIENAIGGAGDDIIKGNDAANDLRGNGGNDTLEGGLGIDTLNGGAGDDTYVLLDVHQTDPALLLFAYDTVVEAADGGIDTVQVQRVVGNGVNAVYTLGANVENGIVIGTDILTLNGNALGNALTGNEAANTLNGGDGIDTLNGGLGADTLNGGADDDIYILQDVHQLNRFSNFIYDDVVEAVKGGIDTVKLLPITNNPISDYTLGANVENGVAIDTHILSLNGNALDNALTGSEAANTLNGGDGNDTLDGADGDDALNGGAGNDTYLLQDVHRPNLFANFVYDDVVEGAGGGVDTVKLLPITNSPVSSYTLGKNIENGVITGKLPFDLIGNEVANQLTGNSAANKLDGGAGDDTLAGLLGTDTLNGGAGLDTALFAGERAAYRITFAAGTMTVTGSDGVDTLTSIERLQFDDVLLHVGTDADFNGDGRADVLFAQQGAVYASNYEWQMNDRAIAAQGAIDLYDKAFTVQVVGDYDGDGKSDVLFQNPATGGAWAWMLEGATIKSQGAVDVADPSYHLLGSADFNGDGTDDLLFRNDAGFVYQWQMNGLVNTPLPVQGLDPFWHVQGAGDFDNDGKADLLLRNISKIPTENGAFFLWKMNGAAIIGQGGIERPPTAWKTLGLGDFDGDGKTDFAVRNSSATGDNGAVWVYLMDGTTIKSQGAAGIANPTVWHVQQIGDLNGDGKDDILFRNDLGYFYSWDMNGTHIQSEGLAGIEAGSWADPTLKVVTEHWDLV